MNGNPIYGPNGFASTSSASNIWGNQLSASTSYDPSLSPQINRKSNLRNDTTSNVREAAASRSARASATRQPPRKLTESDEPASPLTPLSTTQAFYTTYPSRMRLGTTSLLQPNYSAQKNGLTEDLNGTGYRRPRTVVNYAEIEGLEDSEDESNDIDGNGKRKAGGMQGRSSHGGRESGTQTPVSEGNQSGVSYLGSPVPGNLISVQRANLTQHTVCSEDDLEEQAAEEAILIPIQLDLDYETYKLRDSFVWNLKEKLITPLSFATILCDDLDMPHKPYADQIATQITDQIAQHWYVSQIAIRTQQEEIESVEKDLRVILNLDVQIGLIHLVDRIEWDLSSPLTPELFTAVLITDLCLPTDSAPVISNALHQEIQKHKKNCLELGLLGSDLQAANLYHGNSKKTRGAKVLEGIWREWNEIPSFGPRIETLTLDELDRIDAEREVIAQRAKRDAVAPSRTGRRR